MYILILTKSDKKCKDNSPGFCVAGITRTGEWVRLVSGISGDSLRSSDCRFFDVGDNLFVDKDVISPGPLPFQPENSRQVLSTTILYTKKCPLQILITIKSKV